MKKCIILLHGYGSDGHDLSGLGEFWANALPGLSYISPDAPHPCEAGQGFQWFSLSDISLDNLTDRMIAARQQIDALLTAALQQQQIDAERDEIILVGFSQGTMVALDILTRARYKLAGVIGFSGRMATNEIPTPQSGVEVLLVHGEADEVVPSEQTLVAQKALNQAGIVCHVFIEPGVSHTISAAGVEAATQFLMERFALEEDEQE